MNTFTVTIHHTTNYGAVLQAYALQQALLSMGVENEIFDYCDDEIVPLKTRLKDIIKNPVGSAKKIVSLLLKNIHKKQIETRAYAFQKFHSEHLRLSRQYTSMEELRQNPPDAEVLFTGSDQVWRFSEKEKFIEARFLNFGNEGVRKYSYAASIERLNYSQVQKKSVKAWLADYNGISLREQSAADYIHSFTGYETRRVVDPVFLLEKEKWLEIAKKREIKTPYILCYQVQSAPRMQEIVDYLKKNTGYRTVAVLPYSIKWIKSDETLFDVSPEEIIYLFAHAEIVVAASFHGAALGIEFEKIVYATARENYSERINGLMELMGVQDFFISEQSAFRRPEDYPCDKVTKTLQREREKSLEYLSKCLRAE